MKNKFLIIITGPTAAGKTETSVTIAKAFQTEIISADARQIYKELKTGTAVPDDLTLSQVPHHFIHHVSIHDYYNVSIYEQEVLNVLDEIFKINDVAVMVGGSGLYINVICHGIDDLPTVDAEIREDLKQKLKNEGLESLRTDLKMIDPQYYGKADLKNPNRILKALEVYYLTGVPYSALLTAPRKERPFGIIKIGLKTDRQVLYERINARVDRMISDGLVEEATNLYPARHLNALNTVGYKEIFDYLDGKMTLGRAIELIKRNTRRYARRQMTWFNKDKSITWFSSGDIHDIIEFVKIKMGKGQ